jgi:hypothetical protein
VPPHGGEHANPASQLPPQVPPVQASPLVHGLLRAAFTTAGFTVFAFRRFPPAAWHLIPWGYVMQATR